MMTTGKMLGKLGDMFTIDMKDAVAMLAFEVAVVVFGARFKKTKSSSAIGAETFGKNADGDKIVKNAINSAIADINMVTGKEIFDVFDSKRRGKTLDEREECVTISGMVFSLVFCLFSHHHKCSIWTEK